MNKRILIVSIIALAIDQVSKNIANWYLQLNISKTLIKGFFNLTLCHNDGVAFSMLSNHRAIIIILTLVALLLIYHFIFSFKDNVRNSIAFGLLMGGLGGNLIDRVINGYVIDFFDFMIFKYDFPVFNMADVCIVCGVILLVIAIIKGEEVHGNKSKGTK